jgi:hypothetical protein
MGKLFPDHREVESSEEESPWAWEGVKNGLPWVRQPNAAERVTKPCGRIEREKEGSFSRAEAERLSGKRVDGS